MVVDSIRRFAKVPADGGKDLWGTSVSLVVEAQGADVKASTPLPAISARVELGEASATATLQVRGFDDKGFMAQFKSGPLTVETYMEYVTSLEKVRDYIAANEDGMYLAYPGASWIPIQAMLAAAPPSSKAPFCDGQRTEVRFPSFSDAGTSRSVKTTRRQRTLPGRRSPQDRTRTKPPALARLRSRLTRWPASTAECGVSHDRGVAASYGKNDKWRFSTKSILGHSASEVET